MKIKTTGRLDDDLVRPGRRDERHAAPQVAGLEARPNAVRQNEREQRCAEDGGQESDPRLHGTVLSID